MGVSIDVQNFIVPANAAGHVFPVDFSRLDGLTPKAVVVFMSGRSEILTDGPVPPASGRTSAHFSYGFGTGASNRRGNAVFSQDNQATAVESQVLRSDGVLFEIDATPAVVGRLDLDSFAPNRVRFSIGSQFSKAYTATAVALAGSDIENTSIFDDTVKTGTGATTITAPGFQGEFCIFLLINATGGLPAAIATTGFSIGFAVPRDGTNMCLGGTATRSNPTVTAGYCSDAECMQLGTGKMHVTGTDPSGFVFNTDVAFAALSSYSCLVLGGTKLRANINTFTSQFATATKDIAPKSANFLGGFTLSAARANSAGGAATAGAAPYCGAFVGPQNSPVSVAQGYLNVNGVTPSFIVPVIKQTDCYVRMNGSGGTTASLGSVTQQNRPNVYTLRESIADSAQNFIACAVLGTQRLLFVDGDAQSQRSTITLQDGGALALTNAVRVLWDDTVPNAELVPAIKRLAEAINQQTG